MLVLMLLFVLWAARAGADAGIGDHVISKTKTWLACVGRYLSRDLHVNSCSVGAHSSEAAALTQDDLAALLEDDVDLSAATKVGG